MTIYDVANWFLAYNDYLETNEGASKLSHLKLQKLLYYAQSAFLAIKNEPLFSNDIVAWTHGPVIEEIYHKYKKWDSSIIEEYEDVKIDPETEEILIDVYNVFGEYSAWGLRNLIYSEKPWCETKINTVISHKLMKENFLKNYIVLNKK